MGSAKRERIMNWCWHRYGKWRIANEVPIWRDKFLQRRFAVCERPWDRDYLLAGKLIQQIRQCERCGFVQSKFQKITV